MKLTQCTPRLRISILFIVSSLFISCAADNMEADVIVFGQSDDPAAPPYTEDALSSPDIATPTPPDKQTEPTCPMAGDAGQLAECCDLGPAKCVPMEFVPDGLQNQLATCGSNGGCVPQRIIDSLKAGNYTPKVCTSLGGSEGACISTCIPKVADFITFLPQDICEDDERCAPCIDPLTGEDSGACGDGITCQPQSASSEPEPEPEPEPAPDPFSCDNLPSEPIADVNLFNPCCDGAHCVPSALVPPEDQEFLATCDNNTGYCVPDPIIETGGFFVAETCISIGGSEGRCVSTCVPEVAEKMDNLPISTCAANERCSPCCDPFTGEETGACSQGCDTGPSLGYCAGPSLPTCCSGLGHCIEQELVPSDQHENLKDCGGDLKDFLCVPDEMQDPAYAGTPCSGNSFLLGSYEGVCLPGCLKLPLKFTFDKTVCPEHHTCTPCTDPFGGSTGAPGCP
ncbi:MAG: hypothetical protein CMH54_01335 [Myxococcales bacterium]|nr:hypothetical protein [Myxococcales bacterium]